MSANTGHSDLEPLQALSQLAELHLWEISHWVDLSHLSLQNAHFTCSQDLDRVGALQQLFLEGSTLVGSPVNGLSACTGLREFLCSASHLGATNQSQYIKVKAGSLTVLPDAFPPLTHLTRLDFAMCSQVTGHLSFGLFSTLTALQDLPLMEFRLL